jgi:hypothetical protein
MSAESEAGVAHDPCRRPRPEADHERASALHSVEERDETESDLRPDLAWGGVVPLKLPVREERLDRSLLGVLLPDRDRGEPAVSALGVIDHLAPRLPAEVDVRPRRERLQIEAARLNDEQRGAERETEPELQARGRLAPRRGQSERKEREGERRRAEHLERVK